MNQHRDIIYEKKYGGEVKQNKVWEILANGRAGIFFPLAYFGMDLRHHHD